MATRRMQTESAAIEQPEAIDDLRRRYPGEWLLVRVTAADADQAPTA